MAPKMQIIQSLKFWANIAVDFQQIRESITKKSTKKKWTNT